MSLTSINQSQTFDYTGDVQTFTPTCSGIYKLEVWGAQGGGSMCNGSTNDSGGYGGYSYGEAYLRKGETIYICVGGKGTTGKKATAAGGYNGGGSGTWDNSDDEGSGGGGGATHIAKMTGTLATIGVDNKDKVYIVAGGGGGRSWEYTAGTGGGTNGGTGGTSSSYPTQTSGYAFGQGQNGSGVADNDGVAGGGGGWYGGYANNVAGKSSGTGGSGYIGGVSNGATSNGQRAGAGQAAITLIERYHELYIEDKQVQSMYLGNKIINNVYLGELII